MNIRALDQRDTKILKEIWEEFYSKQFSFPVFMEKPYLCAFAAYDDENRIISAGGVRTIVESVVLTDKRQSVRDRREALFNILAASEYVAQKAGYNEIHAFVQDDMWSCQLGRVGFKDTAGRALVLELNNGKG